MTGPAGDCRRCEVCGRELAPHNRTRLCRKRPECQRERWRRQRRRQREAFTALTARLAELETARLREELARRRRRKRA